MICPSCATENDGDSDVCFNCRAILVAITRSACRPTRPTAESRRRRLAEKKLVGARKQARGRVHPED